MKASDWRPILRALSVSTLVIHGTEDALPTEVAEELAEFLPEARLALIPDRGQVPLWEAPETLFPAIESSLLARASGPAAV